MVKKLVKQNKSRIVAARELRKEKSIIQLNRECYFVTNFHTSQYSNYHDMYKLISNDEVKYEDLTNVERKQYHACLKVIIYETFMIMKHIQEKKKQLKNKFERQLLSKEDYKLEREHLNNEYNDYYSQVSNIEGGLRMFYRSRRLYQHLQHNDYE